jgi:aryl-alcohol dehydrogenase-like predicted oxidoreductase
LKECIDAYDVKLTPDVITAIDEIHQRMPNPAA